MSKGGRTSTTWTSGSSWNNRDTKTIRVPIALEEKIMSYARALDSGIALSHGNAEMILDAIAAYIAIKEKNYHPNQHSKKLDTSTRPWDELRKFKLMVQNEPEKLGF